ncbi:MAG: DegT/DnrJ/EryC1/StrS family aminotransferase [Clostridia bacterium]|nr:DegT/DnrJ/EryC1/StrS family aminotransferase [Clostridia bacterium]
MIPVTRSVMPAFEEYAEEIRSLWDSRWLTNMGEKHRALEQKLAELLGIGTDRLRLFANGHLALEAMLRAADLPEGAEIITTPFTFASTTNAIIRCGFTPVFCDVKREDLTIDPAKVGALITERTAAILPVHVYGGLCDVPALEAIAEKHGLKLFFDAAHAFGDRPAGRSIAEYGDGSMFSFHATKVFHTIEGGCVVFKDPAMGARLDAEKNFGLGYEKDAYTVAGGNAKMNEFAAAMGLCNLRHLDDAVAARQRIAARFRTELGDIPGLTILNRENDPGCNEIYFPVLAETERDRDALAAHLQERGVGARKYFYPATNELPYVTERFGHSETPVAADASRRVLTLPIYPELTEEELQTIFSAVRSYFTR